MWWDRDIFHSSCGFIWKLRGKPSNCSGWHEGVFATSPQDGFDSFSNGISRQQTMRGWHLSGGHKKFCHLEFGLRNFTKSWLKGVYILATPIVPIVFKFLVCRWNSSFCWRSPNDHKSCWLNPTICWVSPNFADTVTPNDIHKFNVEKLAAFEAAQASALPLFGMQLGQAKSWMTMSFWSWNPWRIMAKWGSHGIPHVTCLRYFEIFWEAPQYCLSFFLLHE